RLFPTRRSSDLEWTFEPRGEDATYVTITASGFEGSDDEKVAQAIDAMGGFTAALVACKAYLEHGVLLNLIADYEYDGAAQGGPDARSEEHTSELQSRENLVCRLLLEKQKCPTYARSAA